MTSVAPSHPPAGEPWSLRWRRERRVLVTCGVLLLLGIGLCLRGTPLWWFGAAIVAASLTVTWRVVSEPAAALRARAMRPCRVLGIEFAPWRAAIDVLYLAILLYLGTVMMSEITGGERPVSHDHTLHYFKSWQLHRYFLPEGKLFGWSHRFFAGYPVNYLYPPGTDLWVNAVHALGAGFLSFSESYAVAFWFFHLFTGVAAYRFGRTIGGQHVGFLAALLMLTDLSEFRLGGWDYTIKYGVWPQALSLNFGLLAVSHIPALVERHRISAIGAFAIWTGLAIITHPAALIFMVVLLVVTPLAAAFAERVRAPGVFVRLLLASLLAVGVALVWLIPFLSSRSETYVMGVWWDTTYEIAKGLLDLQALPGTLPHVLALGVLAIVVMLRTRRFLLLFCALMALFVPLVSSSTFVDELHLPALWESFTKIQYIRMSTMVKPFWFVLAAYFLVSVLVHAKRLVLTPREDRRAEGQRASAKAESYTRSGVLALIAGLLTLPFLVPAAEAFWTRHVRKSLVTVSDRPYVRDRQELVDWLEKNLPRGEGFYRVGVFMGHNHDLLDLAAKLDLPFYKRGFTPATNFIYKMKEQDRALLEAVNLRFAISKKREPKQLFELVRAFGIYRVYRFRFWTPEPFEIIEGAGEVSLERFGDEHITLRAAPGSHGKLRLNVSYFSRWHAYRDGEPVDISLTYLKESPDDTGFITVPLSPGRYDFVFERTLGDRLALPLGLLSLACALCFIVAQYVPGRLRWLRRSVHALGARFDRMSAPHLRRWRLVALWMLLAALLAIGVGLAEWRPPLAVEKSDKLEQLEIEHVRFDFLENLSRAHANIEYRVHNQPCLPQNGRLVCRDLRGNLDNERFIASTPTNIEEYKMVRCIRARPEHRALLSITFPRVPMGDAIVGYYGVEREGRLMHRRRPVDFEVMVANEKVYDGHTESDNRMHWFQIPLRDVASERADVVFSVSAKNVSKRYFCFYAQVVDVADSRR